MPDTRTVLPAPKLLDLIGIRADASVRSARYLREALLRDHSPRGAVLDYHEAAPRAAHAAGRGSRPMSPTPMPKSRNGHREGQIILAFLLPSPDHGNADLWIWRRPY